MATPLDISIIGSVGNLFPFLLVLVITYGVLAKVQIFGDNKGAYGIIAFVLAIATMFSPIALKTIDKMAPWFVLLFVFTIFLLVAFQAFGVKSETITDIVTKSDSSGTFFWWMLALILIITLGSLASVISEEKGFKSLAEDEANQAAQQGDSEEVGFFQTLFHPKILGMMLLFLIALFTIRALAYQE
jgi:hypothetical protein